jgi:hypothetical protein
MASETTHEMLITAQWLTNEQRPPRRIHNRQAAQLTAAANKLPVVKFTTYAHWHGNSCAAINAMDWCVIA